MINNVRPFRFWCQKVLPLVYDDSLSYYEVLCKLKHTVNQLIQNNNNMEDFITERLDAMIEDYIKSGAIDEWIQELLDIYKEDIYYHCIDGIQGTGQCGALDVHGHVYLFDVGYEHAGEICDYLTEHKLTDIRGIIISHYDKDHILNLQGVLNNPNNDLDFSNCVAYLPHSLIEPNNLLGTHADFYNDNVVVTMAEWYAQASGAVQGWITSAGIEINYPSEGDSIVLSGNCSLAFHNLKREYFNTYYPLTMSAAGIFNDPPRTMYNNFSMISKINFWNHYMIIAGDCQEGALNKNYQLYQNADVVIAPHHGLNKIVSQKYLQTLNADVFAIQTGEIDYNAFQLLKQDSGKMLDAGAAVFCTYDSGSAVITFPATSKAYVSYTKNPFAISRDSYSLGFGEMLHTPTILGGTDINTLLLPGVYTCHSSAVANTCPNNPFPGGAGNFNNSGFKLIVEFCSDWRRPMQTAYSNTSGGLGIAYRRAYITGSAEQTQIINNDASSAQYFKWTDWEYIFPTEYYNINATNLAQHFESDLTVVSANYTRARAANSVFMINLDVKANSAISGGAVLLRIRQQYQVNQGYFLLQNITKNTVVSVSTSTETIDDPLPNNPNHKVYDVKLNLSSSDSIAAGDRVRGTVTALMYPNDYQWD